LLPFEDILYFADQGHVPYGPRPLAEIQGFVRGISRFFLERNAKIIVIACNAASAGGLKHVREVFPEVPFIGMEPAVKPAAERTRKGVIGVITTKATYQGELFASVIDRFAKDVQVVTQVCPEFVTRVELGDLDGSQTRRIAQEYLQPLLDAGIDQLVLGCTHFPFLTPLIQDIVGDKVEIVDPGPAIARQTGRVTADKQNAHNHAGDVSYFTSGDLQHYQTVAERLMGISINAANIHQAYWTGTETVHAD
jgi:glutamate racemase